MIAWVYYEMSNQISKINKQNLNVDITFQSEREANEFAEFLKKQNQLENNSISHEQTGKQFSIQANPHSTNPKWESEFYLRCSQEAQRISQVAKEKEARERKAREDAKKLAEQRELVANSQVSQVGSPFGLTSFQHHRAQHQIHHRENLVQTTESIPPAPQPLLDASPRFVIHPGIVDLNNRSQVEKTTECVSAIFVGGYEPGYTSNISIEPSPFSNRLFSDVVAMIKDTLDQTEKDLLKIRNMNNSEEQTFTPEQQTKLIDISAMKSLGMVNDARAQAKSEIDKERDDLNKAKAHSISRYLGVSQETAQQTRKGIDLFGKGMAVMRGFAQGGLLGAICGAFEVGMESVNENANREIREMQRTNEILMEKMQLSKPLSSRAKI